MSYSLSVSYFFLFFIFLGFVAEKINSVLFSKVVLSLTSLGAVIFTFKGTSFVSLSLDVCFPIFVLAGSSLLIFKKPELEVRDLFVSFFQIIFSFYLLATSIYPLHVLAIVLLMRSLRSGRNSNDSHEFEFVFTVSLLVLMLLLIILGNGVDYSILKGLVSENRVVVSLVSFLLFVPFLKTLTLFWQSRESDNIWLLKDNIWLWLGVIYSYILKLTIDVELAKYLNSNLVSIAMITIIIFLIFISFRAEAETKPFHLLTLFILFNHLFCSSSSFLGLGDSNILFWSNNVIVLVFLLVNEFDEKRTIEKALSFFILLIFTINFPFSPWFSFKHSLIGHFLENSQFTLVVLFSLVIGLNFRQQIFFVPYLVRPFWSRKSKPS